MKGIEVEPGKGESKTVLRNVYRFVDGVMMRIADSEGSRNH